MLYGRNDDPKPSKKRPEQAYVLVSALNEPTVEERVAFRGQRLARFRGSDGVTHTPANYMSPKRYMLDPLLHIHALLRSSRCCDKLIIAYLELWWIETGIFSIFFAV